MNSKSYRPTDLLSGISSNRSAIVMAFSALAMLVFMTLGFRNIGLHPGVFADEWIYSAAARLTDISQAVLPSYLFLLIFGNTSSCGSAFLECARLLNAGFIVLTMPFIYLVARRYVSAWASLLIAGLTAVGPFSSYSAYFMPETLYFFGFWVFVWHVLGTPALTRPVRYGAMTGALLGLMMMIKFHALFLLIGFCAFLLLCLVIRSPGMNLGKALIIAGTAVAAALLVRFSVGYLIAGRAGLSLTGSFYGNMADSTLSVQRLWELIPLILKIAGNHLLALVLLFGVPLATLLAQPASPERQELAGVGKLPLLPLVTALLFVLVGVTAVFSATVAGANPYESPDRVHMRYYDFLFPLLFILAAAQLKTPDDAGTPRVRTLMAALVTGSLAVYALTVAMHRFVPNHVDHPDLRGFMAHPTLSIVLGCLGLMALAAWGYRRRLGAQLFVFLFLPLSLLSSGFIVSQIQAQRMNTDKYDHAGEFVRLYLAGQTEGLVIVGYDPSKLIQTQFHIDSPQTRVVYVSRGEVLDASNIPPESNWLLIFDAHDIRIPTYGTLDMGEYSLIRLTPANVIDFRRSTWPGVLGRVDGLSHPEPFGRWSNAANVDLQLATPVTGHLQILLEARAFGPNVGQRFTLQLGDQEQTFTLGDETREILLDFELSGPAQRIRIKVPQPISPRELGMSTDDRLLGIALHKLQIRRTDET